MAVIAIAGKTNMILKNQKVGEIRLISIEETTKLMILQFQTHSFQE